MPGFAAVGHLAVGQVADAGSTFALSLVAGAYAITNNSQFFSVRMPSTVASYSISATAQTFKVTLSQAVTSYIITFSSVSFVSNFRRPLYRRGASYWKGVR